MNLDIVIDKKTCFYYWLQAISNWDPPLMDSGNVRYREEALGVISDEQNMSLGHFKQLLSNSKDPRGLLGELYSNQVVTDEAKLLVDISLKFVDVFESVWADNVANLEKFRNELVESDFDKFKETLSSLVGFFDSNFDVNKVYRLCLVQNKLDMYPIGLTISNMDYILVRPAGMSMADYLNDTIAIILHEYIHLIERSSSISRELFKKSFEKYIKPNELDSLSGYSWKMMFVEAMIYSFASTKHGGYFRPLVYDRPILSIDEQNARFDAMTTGINRSPVDIISNVGLRILPEVEAYVKDSKVMDSHISDKIAKVYSEILLTRE